MCCSYSHRQGSRNVLAFLPGTSLQSCSKYGSICEAMHVYEVFCEDVELDLWTFIANDFFCILGTRYTDKVMQVMV